MHDVRYQRFQRQELSEQVCKFPPTSVVPDGARADVLLRVTVFGGSQEFDDRGDCYHLGKLPAI